MFQLSHINTAHSEVISAVGFPNYIQDLIKIGVKKYETYVIDGHILYFGENDYQIKAGRKYPRLNVANISDKERFKHYLKNHQRGQTDYHEFCKDAAETGVEKWIVDMVLLTCTYYDKSNTVMQEEKIPTP